MTSGRRMKNPVQEPHERAAPPGLYRCPRCGELLSSPARFYSCPVAQIHQPVEKAA